MLGEINKLHELAEARPKVLPKYIPTALTPEGEQLAVSGGTITSDTSANTKGAWVELTSATATQAYGFILNIQTGDTGISDFLVDIGIGGAGSEVVIVPNVLYSSGGSDAPPGRAFYPIPIPAGTRIAARSQCNDLSQRVRIIVTLCDGNIARLLSRRVATSYGTDTSTTTGTSVNAGASTNTKGAWAEITASVTATFDQCVLCVSNRNNAAATSQNILLDLGVGAAASETVIVPDLYYRYQVAEEVLPKMTWIPVTVRAGQRLAARIQSTSNDATDRIIDVGVIGFS